MIKKLLTSIFTIFASRLDISDSSLGCAYSVYKYEKFTGHAPQATPKELVTKVFTHGKLSVDLDTIPWKFHEDIPRSYNFWIHSLDMINPLLLSHSEYGNVQAFELAKKIALEWCRAYTYGKNSDHSPFIWYDMAAGLRAYRLAYIYDVMRANNEDSAELSLLKDSLWEHKKYLEDDKNITFHSNHGFYQIVGQIALGRRLKDTHPEMDEFHKQGLERFKHILACQFTEEGIHKENSPDYHRMLSSTLSSIAQSGLIDDAAILELIQKVEDTLVHFIGPDSHIVQLGDSDKRDMGSFLKKHSPPHGLTVFPKSGYTIIRQPWKDSPELLSQQSYLALNAGFHSRTHRHADDLHFIWYDKGRHLLVDSGRFGYEGKTPMDSELRKDGHWYSHPARIYVECTRAHNTLEFDGKNNSRKRSRFYESALQRCTEIDGVFILESEIKLSASVRRSRTLLLAPRQWLIVLDWYKDFKKEPHHVRQWFHTAPDIQMAHSEQGFHAQLTDHEDFYITSLLSDMQAMPVIRGQKEPYWQGWTSSKHLEIEPNDAFGYELKDKDIGNFATLCSFSSPDVDYRFSEVSACGRSAKLRWRDDRGEHTVIFKRPTEGELTFSHTVSDAVHMPAPDLFVITPEPPTAGKTAISKTSALPADLIMEKRFSLFGFSIFHYRKTTTQKKLSLLGIPVYSRRKSG